MSLRQPDDPERLSPGGAESWGGPDVCVASTRVEVPEFRVRRPGSPGEVDLLWSVLPEVAMLLIGTSAVGDRGTKHAVIGFAKNLARALAPAAGPTLTRVGTVLVVDTSVQTERVTSPLAQELSLRHGRLAEFRLPRLGPRAMAAAGLTARRVGSRLAAALSAADIAEPPGLRRELLKVEVLRRRTRAARLSDTGMDAIVVGTQQNSSARAMLSATRDDGIASYYLPHAPMVNNAFYRDLPTTYALLRGPAEVDHYAAIGVEAVDRMKVVGHPGAAQRPGDEPASVQDIVYAPSPCSPAILRADIEVIRGVAGRPVSVSLHPRMRAADLTGLIPPEWRIVDAPNTDAYLRSRGAGVVIQHGSGVGLEALFLGIEVIDLCHAGETPNYPYIRQPHVQIVHDTTGLSAALQALPTRADQRAERLAFARSWCADVGAAAARKCADAIEETRSMAVPPGPLLDGWRGYLSER